MNAAAHYEALLGAVRAEGACDGWNYVAFSGGVDSALVARAVHEVFPARAVACLGVSASLSAEQEAQAVAVAAHIGIPLQRITTDEGAHPAYIANEGMSCYHCKTALYDAMADVAREAARIAVHDGLRFVLFNGTNRDDLADDTRVGLIAAREHRVVSPLHTFTKDEVRAMARHAGLPVWNHAAMPCLRSRLAAGVPATADHMARIAEAERRMRTLLALPASANLRVRHMPDGRATVEVDADRLAQTSEDLCAEALLPLGFRTVRLHAFRSGGIAVHPASNAQTVQPSDPSGRSGPSAPSVPSAPTDCSPRSDASTPSTLPDTGAPRDSQ